MLFLFRFPIRFCFLNNGLAETIENRCFPALEKKKLID
ncbi:hypothetical protein NIES2104_06990 [Leptolyngbya sp. NIES-2104]|nr:hypothetical protein NIES2104_06990 [Leptolyngbya sp. NIES-2104]